MKTKEESDKMEKSIVNNILFSLKMCSSMSRKLLIATFFTKAILYANWVFFSAIFMKKIVKDLDQGRDGRSIIIYIVLSGVCFAILGFVNSYIECLVKPLERTKLFDKIYSKIFYKAKNVELRCFENASFYNKYTMALDGAEEKIMAIVDGFFGAIVGSFALIEVFWLMYQIDKFAVAFIVFPLIGNFVFGNLKSKYEYKRYQEYAPNDKMLNYVNRSMYLIDYAKEIRMTSIFSLLKKQHMHATENKHDIAKKYSFANASLNFWKITFSFTTIFEGMLFYSSYRYAVSHTIDLAGLTVITGQMVAMAWIVILLFNDIMAMNKNSVFVNNLRGFLEYKEEIPEDQTGIAAPKVLEKIEFEHVCFTYSDKNTINDLSFTINKGEMVALVGHNGAGKTTIIKLLLRLYDPTSGVIKVNDVDIRKYNLREYRELFATTFQDFCIMGISIKDNVLMGRNYIDSDEVVKDSLVKAGVWQRIQKIHNGIEAVMTKEFDDKGIVLSGGESQKVAVARTFAKKSLVKIFDEPSSALDPIAESELFSNIMGERINNTMVLISHRLSSVKLCDKIFMLENGTIVEEGTHSDLMRLDKKYAQMYKVQAQNYLVVEE